MKLLPSGAINDSHHLQALRAFAESHGTHVVQDATMRLLDGSCLYDLARRDRKYRNYIFGDGWEYAEVSFNAHGMSGTDLLKKKWVHYSVMRVSLPRRLPNVVFDSIEHQRRQFRVTFDPKQYIQLEGNFSNYFATYFGTGYTIDDLSFITPEVMEAMVDARQYDIEIVYDSLLIFGPVQPDPQAQLSDMIRAITAIRKKLLHNILTYRDERVPYDEGRRVVAREGMFLRRHDISLWRVLLIMFYMLAVPFLVVVAILTAINFLVAHLL